jgi:hypothetical protein
LADETEKPLTAAQFTSALADLKKDILEQAKAIATAEATRIADEKPPSGATGWIWRTLMLVPRIFSSGLFFIGLGAYLLYIASTTMGPSHSAFTFVLVVLGVAIMLYGTGTQGIGGLESTNNLGKYNVAIAGGAGVLAFCVAYGMINHSGEMKSAFQVEKKYFRLPVVSRDPRSFLDWYTWEFSVDGVGIPALRQGNHLEVLVPYFQSEFQETKSKTEEMKSKPEPADGPAQDPPKKPNDSTDRLAGICADSDQAIQETKFLRTIKATYQLKKEKITGNTVVTESLKAGDEEDFRFFVLKSKIPVSDGGYEFPKYSMVLCINVKSGQRAANDTAVASTRTLSKAESKDQVTPKAPALIPTGGNE